MIARTCSVRRVVGTNSTASPRVTRGSRANATPTGKRTKTCRRPVAMDELHTIRGPSRCGPDGACQMLTIRTTPTREPGDGGRVWSGGESFAEWLCTTYGPSGLQGVTCVELGAGTGITGLMAALLGATVLLTDIESAVPNMLHNIQSNLQGEELTRCDAVPFVWGVTPSTDVLNHPLLSSSGGSPNVVMCADVIYQPALVEPLLSALLALCGKNTVAYIFVMLRPRALAQQKKLFKGLEAAGFHCRRVLLTHVRDRYLVAASLMSSLPEDASLQPARAHHPPAGVATVNFAIDELARLLATGTGPDALIYYAGPPDPDAEEAMAAAARLENVCLAWRAQADTRRFWWRRLWGRGRRVPGKISS